MRTDMAQEDKQEKEAIYQKRVDQLEKKEKKGGDGDDWMNAKAYGADD